MRKPVASGKLEDIKFGISILFRPGQIVEIRGKKIDGTMVSEYFSDHEKLAQVLASVDAKNGFEAIWYTLQPIKPDVDIEKKLQGGLSTDRDDIASYHWLVIDVDRPKGDPNKKLNATDAELTALAGVRDKVIEYLKKAEFPDPVIACSGNGWHLLYRLADIPVSEHWLLKDVLKGIDHHFQDISGHVKDGKACQIDTSLSEPEQVIKAYGTVSRKSPEDGGERPWRRSYILHVPNPLKWVNYGSLYLVASEAPTTSNKTGSGETKANLEWLDTYGVPHWCAWGAPYLNLKEEYEKNDGEHHYVLETCPMRDEEGLHKHSGDPRKTEIIVFPDMGIGFSCFSDENTLGEVIAKVNRLKGENYPHRIFAEEPVQELLNVFGTELADVSAAKAAKVEEEKYDEELKSTPEPAPSVEPKAAEYKPTPDDKFCDELCDQMLAVVLHHPKESFLDAFQWYVRRIKDKLGMNNPPTRRKPIRGEIDNITVSVPFGPTLMAVIIYVDEHKELPDKEALKNFIRINPRITKGPLKDLVPDMLAYIDKLQDKPVSILDETLKRFVDVLDVRFEYQAVRAAIPLLREDGDIQGFRTALRRNQNKSTVQDSNMSQGSWQEKTDETYDMFRRDIEHVDDPKKFKTGFHTIDASGINIGLGGASAICFMGPSDNRKSTAVLSLAMNFAIGGKRVLFLAGEHQVDRVLKKLTLMLTHFNEKLGLPPVPSLRAWEGLNPTATAENLAVVKELLLQLKAMTLVPGYLEPQNIDTLAQGYEDRVDAILEYAESTFAKYQWDCIVIDPVDHVMPDTGSTNKASMFQLHTEVIRKLLRFAKNGFGGKGCMVIITAQFRTEAVRAIQALQEKNTGADRYDDQIESVLRSDGNIHSYTMIIEKFDLCVGVATLTKGGSEGLLVRARSRVDGPPWTVRFTVGENTNYMTELPLGYKKLEVKQESAPDTIDPDLVSEAM